MKKYFGIIVILAVIGGGWFYFSSNDSFENLPDFKNLQDTDKSSPEKYDFSKLSPKFRFLGQVPPDLIPEFVPTIEAINISDKIFIRYFEANSFLTLTTVNILERKEVNINGHEAVMYEIEKKPGVPNFPNQPLWRNFRHKLVDIRMTKANPSLFYVFAYNPDFSEQEFNKFLSSLIFHNDPESFKPPLPKASDRITKKPFGLFVEPENSPVQPEKFTGYHTGTDFEVYEDELSADTEVSAICGGRLKTKGQTQGYGGYAVQECLLQSENTTIVYGHLRQGSIVPIDTYLAPGQKIGLLGNNLSIETDGERKHLHLSIFKGISNDIRGYVPNQSELSKWLNPEEILDL